MMGSLPRELRNSHRQILIIKQDQASTLIYTSLDPAIEDCFMKREIYRIDHTRWRNVLIMM